MSLIYFLLCLILSGMLGSPLSGAIVICAVLAPAVDEFAVRFLGAPDVSVRTVVRLAPHALLCLPLIVREAAASGISLLRLMMSGTLEIEPCIVRIRTKLRTRAGRSALSALIALSSGCLSLPHPPGAVSADDSGDEFIFVHALTRGGALAVPKLPFERILLKMEEKANA